MSKLRFGIVGCGVIANEKHFPSLLKIPEAEIVAVCDIKVEKAEMAVKVRTVFSEDI
jgi:predicted dehydrogenase